MTKDAARNLSINYNPVLNLPVKVYENNTALYYYYTAAGTKVVKNGSTNTLYIGNVVYEGGKPGYILTEEGRLVAVGEGTSRTFVNEYTLKDHLGNSRITFTGANLGNDIDIVQTNSYYPFGLTMVQNNVNNSPTYSKNKYLYNGKELQDEFFESSKLNWLDYGARFYDPQIGRWHTQDTYAEKYYDLAPYQYGANNPICNVDVNGDSIWFTYQYDKNKQLSGVTMHVTGKVVNVSSKKIDTDFFANSINGYFNATFKGEFDGIEFNTDANFIGVASEDEINNSDHVIAVADFIDVSRFESGDGSYIDYNGYTPMPFGKLSFVDSDMFWLGGAYKPPVFKPLRTAAHEFGHLLWGMGHLERYENKLGFFEKYHNLMKQSGNGYYISPEQFKDILKNAPYLNKGNVINKFTGGLYNPMIPFLKMHR